MVREVVLASLYNEAQDAVCCFTCIKASLEHKLQWASNSEAAFITAVFSNWKDAFVKFLKHQSSSCHKEAVHSSNSKVIELKRQVLHPSINV